MQHYGVPTRMLDFTLSPFVALYFAVRQWRAEPRDKKPECARLWAIDSTAVYRGSLRTLVRARQAQRERRGKVVGHRVSSDPDDAVRDRERLRSESLARREQVEQALEATGVFRRELERRGYVCVALPISFNPRLANQQGVFLVNGAERLRFEESLVKMMGDQDTTSGAGLLMCLLACCQRSKGDFFR